MELRQGIFYDKDRIVGEVVPKVDGTPGFHPERHTAWVLSAQQLRAIADLLDKLNTRREALPDEA